MTFTTNLNDGNVMVPLTWRGEDDEMLSATRNYRGNWERGDYFTQIDAFPVSETLLTPKFVRDHVQSAAKREILMNLE